MRCIFVSISVGLALFGGRAAPRAQDPAAAPPAKSTYVQPRTPDGQPDISGMWIPGNIGQVERPSGEPWKGQYRASTEFNLTGGRGGGVGAAPTRTAVVDPPDGKIPLLPWAVEKRDEIMAHQDDPRYLDGRALCLPSGTPRMQSPISYNSYLILQKPGYVVIAYEYDHNYRVIPLDGRPHLHPNIRLALGDPRGRWEGNTLVVDSTNFTKTWPTRPG